MPAMRTFIDGLIDAGGACHNSYATACGNPELCGSSSISIEPPSTQPSATSPKEWGYSNQPYHEESSTGSHTGQNRENEDGHKKLYVAHLRFSYIIVGHWSPRRELSISLQALSFATSASLNSRCTPVWATAPVIAA